jgi:hypothetical protein
MDLMDAMVGFLADVGADPMVTVITKDGKRHNMKKSKVAEFAKKNPGSRLFHVAHASTQAQPAQTSAQPQGFSGMVERAVERAAPQGYAPQGYAPQGYAPQGYAPQGYAPQGYAPQMMQAQPIYSQPYQPNVYQQAYQQGYDYGPDADFPDEEYGVSAAVGEVDVSGEHSVSAAVGGTEQYAQVGKVESRWLTDPWTAATADAAYRLVEASGLGNAAARKTLDEIRGLAERNVPLAKQAWLKFGSVSRMKLAGLGVPSVAAARQLSVARPLTARDAATRMHQRDLQGLERLKAGYQAQLMELRTQLERRDWSDETRRQLQEQASRLEAQFAAAQAQQTAVQAAAVAPTAVAPVAQPGELTPDTATADRGDFDADEHA